MTPSDTTDQCSNLSEVKPHSMKTKRNLQRNLHRTVQSSSQTLPAAAITRNRRPEPSSPQQSRSESQQDMLAHREICRQMGIDSDAFYGKVDSGEIIFTREKEGLVYRHLPASSTYAAGSSPGDTLEMAFYTPPGREFVSVLAAFADQLSEQLARVRAQLEQTEHERDAAAYECKRAVELANARTSEHAALSQDYLAVHGRLSRYQKALRHSSQAVQEAKGNYNDLLADLSRLVNGLRELSGTRLAFPLRKKLLALIGE